MDSPLKPVSETGAMEKCQPVTEGHTRAAVGGPPQAEERFSFLLHFGFAFSLGRRIT